MNEIELDENFCYSDMSGLCGVMVEAATRATGVDFFDDDGLESVVLAGGMKQWQLRRLRVLLLNRFGQNVSVPEMSEACGLSPSYFTGSLREAIGRSAHRWSLEIRLEIAKDLGLRTGMSIHDIAKATGFYDPSHLNRWFANIYKSSFGSWRKSVTG